MKTSKVKNLDKTLSAFDMREKKDILSADTPKICPEM